MTSLLWHRAERHHVSCCLVFFVDAAALAQFCCQHFQLLRAAHFISNHFIFLTQNALERIPPVTHRPCGPTGDSTCFQYERLASRWIRCKHSETQRQRTINQEHFEASAAHFRNILGHLRLEQKSVSVSSVFARASPVRPFRLCQEMSIWRDSLTVGWWVEDEMLLSNWKPDRLTDQASDRTVGVCRMGIRAVVSVCVCVWIREPVMCRETVTENDVWRRVKGFNLSSIGTLIIKRLKQMVVQSDTDFYDLLEQIHQYHQDMMRLNDGMWTQGKHIMWSWLDIVWIDNRKKKQEETNHHMGFAESSSINIWSTVNWHLKQHRQSNPMHLSWI